MGISFKVFIEFVTMLFLFMFWFFGLEPPGIIAPRPGIEPTPSALEGMVLITGPPGKSLEPLFLIFYSESLCCIITLQPQCQIGRAHV